MTRRTKTTNGPRYPERSRRNPEAVQDQDLAQGRLVQPNQKGRRGRHALGPGHDRGGETRTSICSPPNYTPRSSTLGPGLQGTRQRAPIIQRTGNSVSADTCPDLTFSLNVRDGHWKNLEENLGSDHFIISFSTSTPKLKRDLGSASMTDWQAYRRYPLPLAPPATADQWAQDIKEAYEASTRKIRLTTENPVVDPHLLHLWDCRRGLTRRWKRQRLNRKLRRNPIYSENLGYPRRDARPSKHEDRHYTNAKNTKRHVPW
ncbi:hypothetical protein HPB50_001565 [Hyalomma asiaticum]|uniref:Uncharacterized protein n=1 Tax=Hyalomma asiaticum TaxID=266040 RepID=A0ACB7RTQ6_HYAAI|nr:hypothetical protein HPB50_001565 [Hyalomma asiaticum]